MCGFMTADQLQNTVGAFLATSFGFGPVSKAVTVAAEIRKQTPNWCDPAVQLDRLVEPPGLGRRLWTDGAVHDGAGRRRADPPVGLIPASGGLRPDQTWWNLATTARFRQVAGAA